MLEALFRAGRAGVVMICSDSPPRFVITSRSRGRREDTSLKTRSCPWLNHPSGSRCAALRAGAVFMRGFSEVIGVAVIIVGVYLVPTPGSSSEA